MYVYTINTARGRINIDFWYPALDLRKMTKQYTFERWYSLEMWLKSYNKWGNKS